MTRPALRILQLGIVVAGLALWHWLTDPGSWAPIWSGDPAGAARWVGRPVLVYQQIADWFASGEILGYLASTLTAAGLALAIGVPAGLLCGLVMGASPRLSAVLAPLLGSLRAGFLLLVAPLFWLWFGSDASAKAALAVAVVFAVVFRPVLRDVSHVAPGVLANVRMLGAGPGQLLRHVQLPTAIGALGTVLRRAVALGFIAAVVGEYLASATGIGLLVLQAVADADASMAIAGVMVAGACVALLDIAATAVARRLSRWPAP